MTLYRAIVRPVLEYKSPVRNPQYQKDIDIIEKVQRRCMRLSYDDSNDLDSLWSLATRRRFTDLCEVYKYVHNLYKTDPKYLFSFPQRQLRGHDLKLQKEFGGSNVRQHFFSHRVVDDWNSLPNDIATSPSPETFKRRLRAVLESENR